MGKHGKPTSLTRFYACQGTFFVKASEVIGVFARKPAIVVHLIGMGYAVQCVVRGLPMQNDSCRVR